jgi:hypothetical protein
MRVLDPGHHYQFDSLDMKTVFDTLQEIKYVKRMGNNYPGNKSAYSGTTLQEVFRSQIDRLKHLDKQRPHPNNKLIITYARMCIFLLEQRAYEQHHIDFDIKTSDNIELLPTNSKGHLWKE